MVCHSERSEESTLTNETLFGGEIPAGFFAALRMTEALSDSRLFAQFAGVGLALFQLDESQT
jgi:hypothetical protein